MSRVNAGLTRRSILTLLGHVVVWGATALLVLVCLLAARELPQDDQPPAYVAVPLDHGRMPSCPEGYDRPRYRDPGVAECLRIDIKETP